MFRNGHRFAWLSDGDLVNSRLVVYMGTSLCWNYGAVVSWWHVAEGAVFPHDTLMSGLGCLCIVATFCKQEVGGFACELYLLSSGGGILRGMEIGP